MTQTEIPLFTRNLFVSSVTIKSGHLPLMFEYSEVSNNRDLFGRRNSWKTNNLTLAWDKVRSGDFLGSTDPEVARLVDGFERLGLPSISEAYFLHAVAYLMTKNKLEVPYAASHLDRLRGDDDNTNRKAIGRDSIFTKSSFPPTLSSN